MYIGAVILSLCVALATGSLEDIVGLLSKQVMAQQDYIEEAARSSGSGIKQIRVLNGGTRPYHYDSHTGQQMMSMHDHANNERIAGLGELTAVLNGVEFRTRHNDYQLAMPHTTKTGFNDNEFIPYPEVPPEVLQRTTVEGQIEEMREWFKAFKNQNPSSRDYRKYFKPVLCYLEGAWTSSTRDLSEPFESDRHFIDAKNWLDLQEKVRFTSYSGGKDEQENYAYLPTRITEIINNSTPLLSQWNYRIRCAPVSLDSDGGLKLSRFRLVDDLTTRMANSRTLEEHAKTRSARFSLHRWGRDEYMESPYSVSILDELMQQIPGYDNYPADILDNAFNSMSLDLRNQPLNSGYYHRRYKKQKIDAMGQSNRRRGYSDPNVFMAQTTLSNIPGAKYQQCDKNSQGAEVCVEVRQRWTYAIPLEVIYLTPLLTWNPYSLPYQEENKVTARGRNGGLTADTAFNGTAKRFYFRTPAAFFGDDVDGTDADTGSGVVGVLDTAGVVRQMKASGTRIFIPNIPNVGTIRTRWPIVPLYNDGNQIAKEVEALKDIVTDIMRYSDMFRVMPQLGDSGSVNTTKPYTIEVPATYQNPPGLHTHTFQVTHEQMKKIMYGNRLIFDTSENLGHSHRIKVGLDGNGQLRIFRCDDQSSCWDGHPPVITSAQALLANFQ